METNYEKEQARAQLESIHELVERLEHSRDCTDRTCTETRGDVENTEAYHDNVDATEVIEEDALEVSVRSDWYALGDEEDFSKPAEYKILLCTGGPAVRIKGRLDGYQQPETAQLEYQDWGTPWTRYPLTEEDISALLTYAGCFYFGD